MDIDGFKAGIGDWITIQKDSGDPVARYLFSGDAGAEHAVAFDTQGSERPVRRFRIGLKGWRGTLGFVERSSIVGPASSVQIDEAYAAALREPGGLHPAKLLWRSPQSCVVCDGPVLVCATLVAADQLPPEIGSPPDWSRRRVRCQGCAPEIRPLGCPRLDHVEFYGPIRGIWWVDTDSWWSDAVGVSDEFGLGHELMRQFWDLVVTTKSRRGMFAQFGEWPHQQQLGLLRHVEIHSPPSIEEGLRALAIRLAIPEAWEFPEEVSDSNTSRRPGPWGCVSQ